MFYPLCGCSDELPSPMHHLRCSQYARMNTPADQALPCKGRQRDGAAGDQAAAGAARPLHRPAAGRVCAQAQEPAAGAQPTQTQGCLHAVAGAIQLSRGAMLRLGSNMRGEVSAVYRLHETPAAWPAGVRVLRNGSGAGHQGQLPDLLGGRCQVVHAGGLMRLMKSDDVAVIELPLQGAASAH